MNNENLKESKAFYTEVAKTKCRQNSGGHNKQMYWDDGKYQYFVEARRFVLDESVTYTKA